LELKETKGSVKFRGKINRLKNGKKSAYAEGKTSNGKDWSSLRFGIKTSPDNNINVELFGMQFDTVPAYNRDKKETLWVDWDKRNDIPEGYNLIGVTVGGETKEDTISLVNKDAVEMIMARFNDDDSVFVLAEPQYSTYNDKPQTKYSIRNIYFTTNPLDFEDEEFSEVSDFEQEFVFINADIEKETNTVYVNGYVIGYKGKSFETVLFKVDGTKYPKLAKSFVTKLKFGDLIKVAGKVNNRAVAKETEEMVEDEFGGEIPASYRQPVYDYDNSMEITGVVNYQKGVYKETDFVLDNEVNLSEDNKTEDDIPDFLKG